MWFWEDSQLAIYWLRTEGADVVYAPTLTTQLLPQLDAPQLLTCVNMAKHVDAIRTFQQSLQH
ncbi:hypothetical protein [Leptolyngbya sp. PCC 6406]|uniref:hypothetical protein n=1 Tax=Leptolyngbya sp. PCC 6406 TaxID=1173264 RepID=UPI0002AC1C5C|nr:hypothetical protein [Leptolyngbya sp. PCC 6406]